MNTNSTGAKKQPAPALLVAGVDVKRLMDGMGQVTADTSHLELFRSCFSAYIVLSAIFNSTSAGGAA